MIFRNIVLLLILGLAVSSKLYADDFHPVGDSTLLRYVGEEVVIESFKQNRGLYIQPISATVLSSKEIKVQNISAMKEFSAFIPNLFMPDYGSKMTSPVYVRGIGSRINSPSVALYVDGVPYFDRSTFDININDVETMEVLRGPQGTIYGRNTMGGVINIYSKSPFKEKGTNVNLSAGSYDNYKTGLSHYGNVNNKVGYSLSADYSHAGGYFKNSFTGKRADPMDAVSLRSRIGWRIMPRLSMHLTLAYEYSDQDGYPYRVFDKVHNSMADVNYNAPSFYKRNLSTNGLQIVYVTDEFKLSSQSSFQFFDGEQGLDQDFTPEDKFYVDFYQRQQMYSQEFNVKSLVEDSKYKWQFGLFGFHQNYFQTNDTDYRTTGKHAVQRVNNPSLGFAVYHQSTLDNIIIPNLSFIFGVRYDWEKTKLKFGRFSKELGNNPVEIPMKRDNTAFSQITPKVSIHYSFQKSSIGYFSVSRGYKAGGFNNTAEDDKDRIYDPEYSWSYELGVKSSFFTNLLHLDFCMFFIDWKDQQIAQSKNALNQGYVLRNAGKTASRGVELTASIRPITPLDFQLAYGYTYATYKKYLRYEEASGDGGASYDGHYLPMVPKNTFSLSANYTIITDLGYLDKLVLNTRYTGAGRIYWNDGNDISQPFYGTLNGKISLVKRNLSVDLWTKNIANKDYITYYFTASGSDFVQKGRPFTFGVDVNYKF